MKKLREVEFEPKSSSELFPFYCRDENCPHTGAGKHTHRVHSVVASVDSAGEPVLPSALMWNKVGKGAKRATVDGTGYIVVRTTREGARLYREVAHIQAPQKTYSAEHFIAHIEAERKR